jgi:hypothetical protein
MLRIVTQNFISSHHGSTRQRTLKRTTGENKQLLTELGGIWSDDSVPCSSVTMVHQQARLFKLNVYLGGCNNCSFIHQCA